MDISTTEKGDADDIVRFVILFDFLYRIMTSVNMEAVKKRRIAKDISNIQMVGFETGKRYTAW